MVYSSKERLAYMEGVAYAAEVIEGHLGSADGLQREGLINLLPELWKKIQELKSYKPNQTDHR